MPSAKKRIKKALKSIGGTSKVLIPKKYISFAVVLFCIFIMGGGIYNILESPPSIIPLQNGYSSLHPYSNEQTSTEGFVIMMINGAIIAGFYMTYRSTQVAYNRTAANRWLMVGIILITLGFGGNYLILRLKQSIL